MGANRSVKRIIKAEKCNYLETLVAEAEEATRYGNMRELYAAIKKLMMKIKQARKTSERQEGEVDTRWRGTKEKMGGPFEELLNRRAPPVLLDIQLADSDLPFD